MITTFVFKDNSGVVILNGLNVSGIFDVNNAAGKLFNLHSANTPEKFDRTIAILPFSATMIDSCLWQCIARLSACWHGKFVSFSDAASSL